eukprot:352307_1
MKNVYVEYLYDLHKHCYDFQVFHSVELNANCSFMRCKNTITFVKNYGQIIMDNIIVKLNVTENQYEEFKRTVASEFDYLYLEYEFPGVPSQRSVIYNAQKMNLSNLFVDGLPINRD